LESYFKNIKNISDDDTSLLTSLEEKDIIEYDDLLSFDKKEYTMYYSIGQTSMEKGNNDEVFIVHPFLLTDFSKDKQIDIQTTNKKLFFEEKNTFFEHELSENTIHLVLTKDVVSYFKNKYPNLSFNESQLIELYYPLLFNENINSIDTLTSIGVQERLIKNTETLIEINDKKNIFEITNNHVQLFRNIYQEKKYNLAYLENGIKQIHCFIESNDNIMMPLEFIFKSIHASEKIPFIQYYPGKSKEKLYRLYSEKNAGDGRKIPFLQKRTIMNLKSTSSEFKKANTITFYIEILVDDSNSMSLPVICQLDQQNNMYIYLNELKIIKTLDEITILIKKHINELINTINNIIQQYGYEIKPFVDFYQSNININNIQYKIKYPYKKQITTKKWLGCLSSIFSVQEGMKRNQKKDGFFRYKRISNYNKMNAIEAFIIDEIKEKNDFIDRTQLIDKLVNNFKELNETTASEKIDGVLEDIQVIEGKRQRFRIKSNPGFPCIIHIEDNFSETFLNIIVSNIDHIGYIEHIKLYLDSFIRITQDIESTHVSKDSIEKICKITVSEKKQEKLENQIEDVEEKKDEDEIGDDDDFDIFDLSDDEVDDDDENEFQFGGEKDSKDITGMSLKNPNVFSKRLLKKDVALFSTPEEGKYKAYSRTCPTNSYRMPVSLTQEEKDTIDKEHPGSYTNAIKYGSTKDKQHWYICPRYWDLKRNIPLTEKDVEKIGKDKIIPKGANKVPTGKHIYKFYNKNEHNPGFVKGKTKDGLCVPCCFKKWNKKKIKECGIKDDNTMDSSYMLDEKDNKNKKGKKNEDEIGDIKDNDVDIASDGKIDDILSYNIFPLKIHRFGYLPPVLQYFLQINNTTCQRSIDKKSKLKIGVPCLLRKGVEYSENQSFIACIADAFKDTVDNEIITTSNMKEYLIENLDIDLYSSYQNGNLVDLFAPKKIDISNIEDTNINLNDYKHTMMYKRLFDTNAIQDTNVFKNITKHKQYVYKVILSMKEFIQYLRDASTVIDHTYLWDMICEPHPFLFPKGLNLIILDIGNDDTSKEVHVVCPTNRFSNKLLYDKSKPCLLLMKKNGFYEPLYEYEDLDTKTVLKKTFYLEKDIIPELRRTLQIIIQDQNKSCQPKKIKQTSTYPYKKALNSNDTINKLIDINYDIENIVYRQSKVCGILCKDELNNTGYVPCYPSSLDSEYTTRYVQIDLDDITPLLNTYKETVAFLKKVHERSNGKGNINTKPLFKMVEDNMIVGVITETNHFVQLKAPEIDYELDNSIMKLEPYPFYDYDTNKLNNSLVMDTNNNVQDTQRILMIRKIKLETQFYNAFRNTVRFTLNKFLFIKEKKEIQNICEKEVVVLENNETKLNRYYMKIHHISDILKNILIDNYIVFEQYDTGSIQSNTTISNCFNIDTCDSKLFCKYENSNNNNKETCLLKIPKNNLLYNLDNEKMYFTKIADELLRYHRIKEFILKPDVLLSFSSINYHINHDEMLMLDSLLNSSYFDELNYMNYESYIHNNVYDFIQPSKIKHDITIDNYSENIQNLMDERDNGEIQVIKDYQTHVRLIGELKKCIVVKKGKSELQLSKKWKSEFPLKTIQLKINNSPFCSFFLMKLIIFYHTGKEQAISDLKNILVDKYKTLSIEKVMELLTQDGKISLKKSLKNKVISIDDMVMNDEYYITMMDLITIVIHYKIPMLLISGTTFKENNEPLIVFNNKTEKDEKVKHFFIVKPDSIKKETIPTYRLLRLEGEKEEFKIQNNRFSEKLQKQVFDKKYVLNKDDYYVLMKKKVKKMKKRLALKR
jgi:hypothetical protein